MKEGRRSITHSIISLTERCPAPSENQAYHLWIMRYVINHCASIIALNRSTYDKKVISETFYALSRDQCPTYKVQFGLGSI